MTPLATALHEAPVLLDGGLATRLEAAGHDVSSSLWSARLLRDDPAAVVAAHRSYLDAGAQVLTTGSYQASREGFARSGLAADDADALLALSVQFARRAQQEAGVPAWVAASVGPYGAVLADGSEYTGAYASEPGSVARLRAFHRPRLEVLAAAGPDVLACETLPALAEVEALVAELPALGLPAWVSLTVVVDGDGTVRTRLGEPAEQAFRTAGELDEVVAVGVNCVDPSHVLPAVRLAAEVTGKPVVAYPNSGERWDAAARAWTGSPDLAAADVADWVSAGARLVGGCCRVGPEQLQRIGASLR